MVKAVPTRDFPIRVTPEYEDYNEAVGRLVEGVVRVKLNWLFDFTFIPFEPQMVPPFLASNEWKDVEDWQSPADARLALFFNSRFVVTSYDSLAGDEFRYSNDTAGWEEDGRSRELRDDLVFYTSTQQYESLKRDLSELLETHQRRNFDERALALQGRPVIDFLVDRLQTSRLVQDEVLYWLGLRRLKNLAKLRSH